MSAHKVGDKVRANTNAQGLTQGALYEVVDCQQQAFLFGTYVTYFVRPLGSRGEVLAVGNGHLLLTSVPA